MQQNTKIFNQSDSPRTLNTHPYAHLSTKCCRVLHTVRMEPIAMCYSPHIDLMKFYYLCPSVFSQVEWKYKLDGIFRASSPLHHSMQSAGIVGIAKQCSSLTDIDCQLSMSSTHICVCAARLFSFVYLFTAFFSLTTWKMLLRQSNNRWRRGTFINMAKMMKQAQTSTRDHFIFKIIRQRSFSRCPPSPFVVPALVVLLCLRIWSAHNFSLLCIKRCECECVSIRKQKSTKGISMRDETA